MLVSVYGVTVLDSYRDGQWSARHVCDPAEELPTLAELREERIASLRADMPLATYGALFELATAWAAGWLSVAELERAAACVED